MDKKNIIVLEDDMGIRELLKSELENTGYNVEIIDDTMTLLDVVTANRPDLIMMDVSMPGMDGITLCHQLKNMPGLNNIPVIIMTAFTDKKTEDDARLFGADDFILKPFSIIDVKAKIKNFLTKD
ncbi:MAG: hypothetical protein A2252_12675 [Elusimicrobia bacterium RIFOXYA2_FULL_39_19]|nr:MAG: hypothetical protein A2252_12675 [Elusimicrobia bacterium RIFOXYA2_FULL_39_19]